MNKSVRWATVVFTSLVHNLESLHHHCCLCGPIISPILAALLQRAAHSIRQIYAEEVISMLDSNIIKSDLCPYLRTLTSSDFVMLSQCVFCNRELMQCSKTRESEKWGASELCFSLLVAACWRLASCGRRGGKMLKSTSVCRGSVHSEMARTHTQQDSV